MSKPPKKAKRDEYDERQAFDDALRRILGAPTPKKVKKKRAKRKL